MNVVAPASEASLPYPDAPNPDLLDRIPLTARVVLDVGCATGALGAAYRVFNPRCEIHGIEANPGAARLAATRLDRVIVGDVEQIEPPAALRGRVDCLIYGDVLEHLRDPWALLQRHLELLAPGGTVLICAPNVEHWSMALRLLQGGWHYENAGLLDRTHLRFFSRANVEAELAGMGLVTVDCASRVFDQEQATRFASAMTPALEALGIEPAAYMRRATPMQYVWRAQRNPATRVHVTSTMLAPVGGVSQVRVVDPMRALATDPGIISRIGTTREVLRFAGDEPRVWIFHRPALLGPDGLAAVRGLLGEGYVVVCEFDDHPDYIPILQRPDVHNFRAVHAVQTTTTELADVLREHNPEVVVFPNALRYLPPPRNHANRPRISLFFGGLNREEDWPPHLDALNQAAREAGEALFFRIVHDQGLFDALDTPHKSFSPMLDYDAYLAELAGCEISFMPLADTPFNHAKSDLKFLEAAGHRVAALASPVVYGRTIEDGRTGFLFHSNDELRDRILQMVAQPDLALAIGNNARAYAARERMLAYQIEGRVLWYRSLWARREELTAALLERVPELRE